MPDEPKPRPILIPPLSRQTGLKVIRDRPEKEKKPEHPHCDEHFLFAPHCAACLEAERTQAATAQATPIAAKPTPKPKPRSSRSFGFTDKIPMSLLDGSDSYEARLAARTRMDLELDIATDIAFKLFDD